MPCRHARALAIVPTRAHCFTRPGPSAPIEQRRGRSARCNLATPHTHDAKLARFTPRVSHVPSTPRHALRAADALRAAHTLCAAHAARLAHHQGAAEGPAESKPKSRTRRGRLASSPTGTLHRRGHAMGAAGAVREAVVTTTPPRHTVVHETVATTTVATKPPLPLRGKLRLAARWRTTFAATSSTAAAAAWRWGAPRPRLGEAVFVAVDRRAHRGRFMALPVGLSR